MSDSLLNALKVFVVVGGVVLVAGTATLIWVLVKRGTSRGELPVQTDASPQVPGTVALPAGAEVLQATLAGSRLLLLGRVPGEGQFVLVVDAATGARRQHLRLVPESR
jgi:hypothetical protein